MQISYNTIGMFYTKLILVEILSEMASAYQLAGDLLRAEQTLRRAQQLASELYGKSSGEALEFEKRLRDLSRTSGSGQ